MKKIFQFLILMIFIISLSSTSIGRQNSFSTETLNEPYIGIEITNAFYADLDGNGIEDDIFVQVDLSFFGASTINFDYYIILTLPSGESHAYTISLASHVDKLIIDNYFWNHATEPGWYTVEVHTVLRTGGVQILSDSMVFDPPGGSEGSDPIGFSIIIN